MSQFAIDEAFLQQIEQLRLLVHNNVAGRFGGNHQSKTFGSSCDFADFREYAPGDDIKKIDWVAFARFDRLFVKLYLDERQMHTRIYIDASRSMAYGDSKKNEQALKLAAALAYLSVCDTDKVSVYTINGDKVEEIISGMLGRDRFYDEIGKLNDVVFDGESKISEAILSSTVGYGDGMSVIISDFLTDENYEDGIDHLIAKKRDVFCMQVLSKEELNPKARGKMHFFDSENTSKSYRKNINKEIINAYRQALEYATGRIRDFCLSRGAEYDLVSAEQSLYELFFGHMVEMGVVK